MKRIVARNIIKKFRIGIKNRQTFFSRFLSLFSGREQTKLIYPLNGISFDADAGEIVGIIGKNGSGKSTLLRIISGIYSADAGEIRTSGKIISLINLNMGIKDRLAMKDNVFLLGALFNTGREHIKREMNSIADFSELGKFMGTKIYQFSEGMKQRFIFSIAVHCNPDILLLDEVFEVGDEEFRKKSSEKIVELAKKGATIVLVSHQLELIRKYCDRAVWIENGKVVRQGDAEKIVKEYKEKEKKYAS